MTEAASHTHTHTHTHKAGKESLENTSFFVCYPPAGKFTSSPVPTAASRGFP